MPQGPVLQVLVDADNLAPRRLRALLDALPPDGVRMTVVGHPSALRRVRWPTGAAVVAAQGWQQADLALAAAYQPDRDPLVLVSGDGDFALLVARHPGPVLAVTGAASASLREVATVVDPVIEGPERVREWLRAVGVATG